MNAGKVLMGLAPLVAGGGASAQERPNIIVILADDLGFSDAGCYGGEIRTPVLDRMAAEGIRLTQLYNTGRSCPSRAALLTGLYPHRTGVGEMIRSGRDAWPAGYRGFRSDNNLTIAEVLRDEGYYTALAGKWHLGERPTPVERGFEDFYGFFPGASDYWDPKRFRRLPATATPRSYAEGTFYATEAITDYAIDFAGAARDRHAPLFLFLSYNAPHFPLQAPEERVERYVERYARGWDAIREERIARLRKMGILPPEAEAAPRGEVVRSPFCDRTHAVPAWDTLSEEQQRDLARRMAVYAAMVEIMDEQIGRLFEALEANGQLEHSLVIFLSDNGACAEWHEFGFDGRSGAAYRVHTGEELAGMGQAGTYHHYGTGWAGVSSTPFRLYKHFAHEGGISAPCIVWRGRGVARPGRIDHTPCHLTDILPTCLAAAGCPFPEHYADRRLVRPEGISLLPLLDKRSIARRRPIFAEHEGNRMVRIGKWKLVASYYDGQRWELYDISRDRAELHDRAAEHPRRVARMQRRYFEWAERNGVEPWPQLMNRYGDEALPVYNER